MNDTADYADFKLITHPLHLVESPKEVVFLNDHYMGALAATHQSKISAISGYVLLFLPRIRALSEYRIIQTAAAPQELDTPMMISGGSAVLHHRLIAIAPPGAGSAAITGNRTVKTVREKAVSGNSN